MGAYGFPDTARLGVIDSNHSEVDSIPSAVATMVPGDLVFTYQGDNAGYKYLLDTAKLVFSADLSASNSTVVTVNGVSTVAEVYGTSHAATMTAIINKVKALTGVECILDSTDSNGRTILIRTKGATNTSSAAVTGGSAVTVAVTSASGQMFRGVVTYATRVPTTVGGTGTILAGQDIPCARLADIWASSAPGLVKTALAYITTAGVFGTSGTDVGARALSAHDTTAVGTLIRLPILPAPMTYGARF